MAEETGIAWTDSTFNPWIGCTKVSPGCDHCYAEAQDARGRWDKGRTHWGAGVPRYRTSAGNWAKPLAWNRAREKDGKTHRVFCASLADVFDNEVPQEWRTDLFRMIAKTPYLTWLVLTKRIGNAASMLRTMLVDHPFLPNVWIGSTIVNQEEANRDVPKLLATPAEKRFVSYEPALGPVDFNYAQARYWATKGALVAPVCYPHGRPRIDWIIVGGESSQAGAQARPFNIGWAKSTIAQCRTAGIASFVKQLGSRCVTNEQTFNPSSQSLNMDIVHSFKDRAGADPTEWPADLRVREFPNASV